jgi:hypothetical protein
MFGGELPPGMSYPSSSPPASLVPVEDEDVELTEEQQQLLGELAGDDVVEAWDDDFGPED